MHAYRMYAHASEQKHVHEYTHTRLRVHAHTHALTHTKQSEGEMLLTWYLKITQKNYHRMATAPLLCYYRTRLLHCNLQQAAYCVQLSNANVCMLGQHWSTRSCDNTTLASRPVPLMYCIHTTGN